jgi:hypothetical protein
MRTSLGDEGNRGDALEERQSGIPVDEQPDPKVNMEAQSKSDMGR